MMDLLDVGFIWKGEKMPNNINCYLRLALGSYHLIFMGGLGWNLKKIGRTGILTKQKRQDEIIAKKKSQDDNLGKKSQDKL